MSDISIPLHTSIDSTQVGGIYGPIHMSPQSIGRKVGMKNPTHFLRESKELEGFSIRVVTNMPTEAEEAAYELSCLHHGTEEIGNSGSRLLVVDIGSQTMPLFMHRAMEMDVKFRFMSVPVKALAQSPDLAARWLKKSNFAWASADNASFIKFEGVDTWGLEPLGLSTDNHLKLAKRLNEVVRVTSHSFYGDITMREFTTPDGMEDSAFDGMNIIRQSFADILGFEEYRGNIRILTELGLIKGDFVVVDNELLDVDVVYHTENLKSELRTNGWTLVTAMAHAPHHELRHDDQSRANFEFFVTHDRVREDLNAMVKAFKESISDGDLAEYLMMQEDAFDDPIAVDYDKLGTAQRIEEMASELKNVGIAPASFSNITFTRLGAIVRKMESRRIFSGGKTKFFKKMTIPAGNSLLGAVVTYEALTLMGNLEFPFDGTETFFDTRFGLVMPAKRFEETYHLHGGWDLDDTVCLFLIKVFCTDDQRRNQLVEAGVLDPEIEVPEVESKAVEVGLMIRRPNGPGEYSIEAITDMPWCHYDADAVPTVDLANAPEDQKSVFAKAHKTGIPTSRDYQGPYNRKAAGITITSQMDNPGVGRFANLLIAWTATFGVGSVPSTLIGSMEDVVDSLQQGADIVSFHAIRDEVDRLWVEFRDKVIATSTPVDYAVWMARIPAKVNSDQIQDPILSAGLLEVQGWTRVQHRYNSAIEFCRGLSMAEANAARLNTPLAKRVKLEKFGPTAKALVTETMRNSRDGFKELDNRFRKLTAEVGDNAVMRRAVQTQRREAQEAFMDSMVDDIMGLDSLSDHRFVLALYKYMVTPRNGWENGDIDRLFVQPSSEGHVSMMELFLEAVEFSGILDDVRNWEDES